ncbi:hypothetical protein GCM10009630_07610 [Kribbella jejuensis]
MRIPRWRFLTALLAASLAAAPLVPPAHAAGLAGANLAAGKPASASSVTQNYVAANVTDGDQSSYWESANNAFPQWVQVDLGSTVATNQVVLKLPTVNWGARDETLAIQGSTDGQNFTDLSASAARTFSPPGNTVTVNYGTATTRYVRVRITANTGWPAGQLSELEAYGPATGDTQAPTAPGSLAYTEPGAGQIKLTWNASTDNVGVTGYDVYANGQLRTSVTGLTYTDNQPTNVSVSYYVRAKDAAGNQSPNSNTVTRNGSGGPGSNLALHKPITASGYTFYLCSGQRERRRRDDVLGRKRQPGDADDPARCERGRQLGRRAVEPGSGLGCADADVLDPRTRTELVDVHHDCGTGQLLVRSGDGQLGHDPGQRAGCRRAAELHREHRRTGRAGGRTAGARRTGTEPGSHAFRSFLDTDVAGGNRCDHGPGDGDQRRQRGLRRDRCELLPR